MNNAPDTASLKDLRLALVETARRLFPTGDGRYVLALKSGFQRHAEIAGESIAALGTARAVASREILALEEALRDEIAPGLLRLLRSANPFSVETAAADHEMVTGSISLAEATEVLAAALAWERRMGAGSVVAKAAGTFAQDCVGIADARSLQLEEQLRSGASPNFAAAAIDVLRFDTLIWSLEALGRHREIREIRRHARRYARVGMEAAVEMLARRRTGGPVETVDLDDVLVIAQRVVESDSEEMAEGRDAFIRSVGWDTVDAFGQLAEQLVADRFDQIRAGIRDGSTPTDDIERSLREIGRFAAIGAILAGPESPPVYARLAAPPMERLAALRAAAAERDTATGRSGASLLDLVDRICRERGWPEAATGSAGEIGTGTRDTR